MGQDTKQQFYVFKDPARSHILTAHLPMELITLLCKHHAYIAGGSIAALFALGRKPKDYDVYFRTPQAYSAAITDVLDMLTAMSYGYIQKSPHWWKIQLDGGVVVDIIGFDHSIGEPEKIIGAFDFTACMGAYDFAEDAFIVDGNFRQTNIDKVLIYNVGSKNMPNSFVRAIRYVQHYGYTISRAEIKKMYISIRDADIQRLKNNAEYVTELKDYSDDESLEV